MSSPTPADASRPFERDEVAGGADHTPAELAALLGTAELRCEQLSARLRAVTAQLSATRRRELLALGQVAVLADGEDRLRQDNADFAAWNADLERQVEALRHPVQRLLGRFGGERRGGERDVRTLGDELPRLRDERIVHAEVGARHLEHTLGNRLRQAADLLAPGVDAPPDGDGIAGVAQFRSAVSATDRPARHVAWLALVTADCRYPLDAEVIAAAHALRIRGADGLVDAVTDRFRRAIERRTAPVGGLDIRRGAVIVDVGHTAANDVHTGIQRVVREVAGRWFRRPDVVPVAWSPAYGAPRVMSEEEVDRFVHWETYAHTSGAALASHEVATETGDVVVPWDCSLVVPEVCDEPTRCDAYRGVVASGVLERISFLLYDMIPFAAAETAVPGISGVFSDYISLVKFADRVSCISETVAEEFRSIGPMLASQGLALPEVRAHPLPSQAGPVAPGDLEWVQRNLSVGGGPLVVVVGTHEPRKNHFAVLEAAERLWTAGRQFALAFIGGGGWRSEVFDAEVLRLEQAGHPVQVVKRLSEGRLWAAYAAARFTLFPSLVEGYGLPIVESLRLGTPVITSNYGSMAEVASGGGAVLVDPRDAEAIGSAIEGLLSDEAALARLEAEAAAREWTTWDRYAVELWDFLAAAR